MKKIKTDGRWGVNCSVVQLLKSLGGQACNIKFLTKHFLSVG